MAKWTVVSSKIASVILESQKFEVVLNDDFLSILKLSEITKILQQCVEIETIELS